MQIISQTLTNAFAQRKLCNLSLVPSIGCTADEFMIYFYDSEQDVLLRRIHKLNLFCNEDMIFESVVELWFVLNATYMCSIQRCQKKYYLNCPEVGLETHLRILGFWTSTKWSRCWSRHAGCLPYIR